MPALNQVTLMGNVTRDIETKYLQSGTAVCDLGLAINERVKQGEEWVDRPTFVDVTLFGRTAEVAGQYLSKGSPVLVCGKLRLDQWEKEGKKHSKLKVVGDSIQLIGGKRGEHDQTRDDAPGEYSQEQVKQPQRAAAPAVDEDSIPFSFIGWAVSLICLGGASWMS